MALTLVTAPAGEPLSLAEAKAHLRVDVADDDALVQGLVAASRQYAETFTHRALLSQTWDLKLDAFCGPITLPMPPVSSITSVKYYDMSGTLQTWSATTGYETDLPAGPKAGPARITTRYGVTWPPTYSMLNAVAVRFVCGYGATGSTVPESIRAAMKILLTHWYEHREAVHIGTGDSVIPVHQTVDALLWPYKAF